MNCWEIKTVCGRERLEPYREAWNRLERRSQDHQEASYEAIHSYVGNLHRDNQLIVSMVFDGPRLVAALPVQRVMSLGMFATARNLACEWFPGRTGLLDPEYDPIDLTGHLLAGLQQQRLSTLELDWLHSGSLFGNAVRKWASQQGWQTSMTEKFPAGEIRLKADWESFIAGWSRNRKKFLRRAEAGLAKLGPLYLVSAHHQSSEEVDRYVDACLKIEDGSWKGAQATSLLKNPFARNHFRDLIQQWHATGRLQLYLLKSNGRPIAFDLGYCKHRVATSLKISYLADYARYSPGHVLSGMVIREMMHQRTCDQVDTVGELTEANRKWCADQYTCGKLEVALPGWFNQSRVQWKDWMRTIRQTAKHLKYATTGQATTAARVSG